MPHQLFLLRSCRIRVMNKNYKAQTIQLAMSKKQNTKMHQETENNKGVGKITENNNCNDVLSEM